MINSFCYNYKEGTNRKIFKVVFYELFMAEENYDMDAKELLRRYGYGERNFRSIILPHESNLAGAHLAGADLRGADLTEANLEGASLVGTDLTEADLTRANLMNANLGEANLGEANLIGAFLAYADLTITDLRGVRNLSKALSIGQAIFSRTIVTNAERAILEKARQEVANLYDLRE